MATSVYFSQKVRSEQTLYEDITIESLKMFGQDVFYLPRQMIRDNVLNDIIESKFFAAYAVEMYIENTQGFEGDGTLMSKFGLEIRDQATFVVARRSWEKLVGIWNNDIQSPRPMEGDLIYYPMSTTLFEIKFVEHEQPFYQLSNLVVYKLQCEVFEYSNEVMNTGVDSIDQIQNLSANAVKFLIENGNGIPFNIGEFVTHTMTGGITITGHVTNQDYITSSSQDLYLSNLASSDGEFYKLESGDVLVGNDSGATWTITKVYDINDTVVDGTFPESAQAQNRDFELDGDSIIDFSESNPFGDPSITN